MLLSCQIPVTRPLGCLPLSGPVVATDKAGWFVRPPPSASGTGTRVLLGSSDLGLEPSPLEWHVCSQRLPFWLLWDFSAPWLLAATESRLSRSQESHFAWMGGLCHWVGGEGYWQSCPEHHSPLPKFFTQPHTWGKRRVSCSRMPASWLSGCSFFNEVVNRGACCWYSAQIHSHLFCQVWRTSPHLQGALLPTAETFGGLPLDTGVSPFHLHPRVPISLGLVWNKELQVHSQSPPVASSWVWDWSWHPPLASSVLPFLRHDTKLYPPPRPPGGKTSALEPGRPGFLLFPSVRFSSCFILSKPQLSLSDTWGC